MLAAGLRHLGDRGAEAPWLCTGSMFVPTVSGVPDTWPHIAAILRRAGYAPEPEREELLYGGRIDHLDPPPTPPIEGFVLARRRCDFAPQFGAELSGETMGLFDVGPDVTAGGVLPALAGWADPWTSGSMRATAHRASAHGSSTRRCRTCASAAVTGCS